MPALVALLLWCVCVCVCVFNNDTTGKISFIEGYIVGYIPTLELNMISSVQRKYTQLFLYVYRVIYCLPTFAPLFKGVRQLL